MGLGIGLIDCHLLAVCKLANATILTKDKHLNTAADQLQLSHSKPENRNRQQARKAIQRMRRRTWQLRRRTYVQSNAPATQNKRDYQPGINVITGNF